MNILVCVKQVPDDFVKVRLGADGKPATADIDRVVNAFDTYAVEMAVRFCEASGGKVVVASLGDEGAVRPSLVQMIAVGAAQAYLAGPTNEAADEGATAVSLMELIKQCEETEGTPSDIILCGKESTDEISSQVGAILAEKMQAAFVSSVVGFESTEAGLKVKQETEDGFAWYETTGRAVFTVAKPDYDPRYPNLKSKMAARKAVIPYYTELLSSPVSNVRCLGYAEPPKREAGVKIVEKEAAEAVSRAVAMMVDDKVL